LPKDKPFGNLGTKPHFAIAEIAANFASIPFMGTLIVTRIDLSQQQQHQQHHFDLSNGSDAAAATAAITR